MAEVSTGFWIDRSQSAVLGATLTLPVDKAFYLLSFLSLLITVAGASFWNLTAIILHGAIVKSGTADALGLQHQVAVQNLGTSPKVIWASIKIHHAWVRKGVNNLTVRTLSILLPAALVWGMFSAASILSSRVATTSDALSRLRSDRCGFWYFENGSVAHDVLGQSRKIANDSIQARNYVSTFYNRAASTPAKGVSLFKTATLPFTVNTSAPCPFRNPHRCHLGQNGAFSMTTPLLNSHDALGINSYPSDQVTFQYEATCSPVNLLTSTEEYTQIPTERNDVNRTSYRILFGPYRYAGSNLVQNWTYQLYEETTNVPAGYILQSFYHIADSPLPPTWMPIDDFQRTDADMTMFFLSQSHIFYLERTFDPWFLANGSDSHQFGGLNGTFSTSYVTALGCTEQFRICNPTKGADFCSPLTGLAVLQKILQVNNDDLGLNDAQLMAATRILVHMSVSTLYYNVMSLGGGALWANDLLYNSLSPGLPDNQWQSEALGWFQTSLTKLQLYTAEFAANSADLGPYGTVNTPRGILGNLTGPKNKALFEALQDQCDNQLVRTTGEVQNFSFLGIMIILCVSLVIIILDMSSGVLVGYMRGRGRKSSLRAAARQGDNMFHLLRLALLDSFSSKDRWTLGRWDMPVLLGNPKVLRPRLDEETGLATYQDSHGSSVVQYNPTGIIKAPKSTHTVEQVDMDSLLIQE